MTKAVASGDDYEVVVVGAGHAGVQIVSELVHQNYSGRIALLNSDSGDPYERPPLSKTVLRGEGAPIPLSVPQSAPKREVTLIKAAAVDTVNATGHFVETTDRRRFQYETLVWAAGGRARTLDVPGHNLTGIHYLRTENDAIALRGALTAGGNFVVVGGGLIGLEAAASLRHCGVPVTVVEATERLVSRSVAHEVSGLLLRRHRQAGVDVRLNSQVERFQGSKGRLKGVLLSSGEYLSANHVLVGVGIVPNIEPIADAGATISNGIEVDQFCRTSLPNVFAAGDCSLFSYAIDQESRVQIRLESIHNAVEQAKIVAARIVNPASTVRYEPVPRFWSQQYDLNLKSIGLSLGSDERVLRGNASDRECSIVYLRKGRILAVDTVNATHDYAAASKVIGKVADRAAISDASRSLRDSVMDLTSLA